MTPLPLLVLEAGSDTKFLTIFANPTLWTFFGSHKELGGTSQQQVSNGHTDGGGVWWILGGEMCTSALEITKIGRLER
jgi:hypothetical protein